MQPIVIIGTGRSGTSELWRIMLNKFDYAMAYEPRFVVPLSTANHGDLSLERNQRKLLTTIGPWIRRGTELNVNDALSRITEPTYAAVIRAALLSSAADQGKTRIGWKDPADSKNLLALADLFPDAKFIHIMRNAHDVAASLVSKTWGPTHLYTGARYWRNTVQEIWSKQPAVRGKVLEVRFEELLLDKPEATVRALAEFIGCESQSCLDRALEYIERKSQPEKIRAWKHQMDRAGRRYVEAAAQAALLQAGYETEFGGQARISAAEAGWISLVDAGRRAWNRVKARKK